ncbi:MAG: DUF1924 domain-containing protein [Methylotenera sp.]|nr:DUF1924 domain-containing protein [Methylotenera sp.]MDD4925071.1 DUF1924 domain-containing protein [Methylotenera sp.]
MKAYTIIIAALALVSTSQTFADVDTAQQLVKRYATIAKMQDSSYTEPSAGEGKIFFNRKVIQFKGDRKSPGKPLSCASCHTENPADNGKHIVTGKKIKPLSPTVNPKRFDDIDHVEKQFAKHCNEIIGSDCTPQEKASYIAFLIEEKTPSSGKK